MSDGLVVEAPNRPGPFEAGPWRGEADLIQLTGPVSGLVSTAESLGRGDFLEAGLDLAGTGLSVLGFVSDPLAGLFSVGIGFLVDHLEPFPTWLDQLCGDPDAIEAFSATWSNVAGRVHEVADDYAAAARSATGEWSGVTSTAYEAAAEAGRGTLHALGSGIDGVAIAMELAGAAVGYVRGLVRDKVVSLVSFALARAVEFLSLVGAGSAIVRFAVRVARDATEIRKRLDGLLSSVQRLEDRLWRLLGHLDQVGSNAQQWSSRVGVDVWARAGDKVLPVLSALAAEDDDGPVVAT